MFLAPFLAVIPLAAPQEATADHTGLLPSNAVVVVRLESLDAFHVSLTRLARTFGEASESGELPIPAKEALLGELFGLPVGSEGVDFTRPVYLGMDVTFGAPLMTALLPAADAAAITAAATEAGAKTASRGEWVAVSTKPDYAPGDANPLLGAMEPGVVSVHVDLESLLELYGGLLDMVLTQAESNLEQVPEGPSGVDLQAATELSLDWFRAFLDSAESLDLGLHESESELTITSKYTAQAGSDLDSGLSALPLPATLSVPIDPDAQIKMLMSARWSELWENCGPWIQDLLEIYPDEMRGGLETYMDALAAAYAGMGETIVAFGDFTPNGLEVSTYATVAEGADLGAKLASAVNEARSSLVGMGLELGEVRDVELAGVAARQFTLKLDYEKLMPIPDAASEDATGGEAEAQAQLEQMSAMMESIYGKEPKVTIAQAGGRACIHMGNDEERLARSIAALTQPAVSASPLLAGLRGLPKAPNPMVVYEAELGDLIHRFGALAGADVAELPNEPLATTWWLAVEGRAYHAGFTLDPVELAGFAQAMKDQ